METMSNRRPERDLVERAYKENSRRKAYEIAEETGLIDAMGYDKAVSYVRQVKKSMRESGQITTGAFASDEDRLTDITTLFDLRAGKMSQNAAYILLLLNCYYRLRSEDDDVHLMAIDDTYEKNRQLEEPFTMETAIHLCEIALERYMNSRDEARNEAARRRGLPGAGMNYTDERFIEKLEITESEMAHMISIKIG